MECGGPDRLVPAEGTTGAVLVEKADPHLPTRAASCEREMQLPAELNDQIARCHARGSRSRRSPAFDADPYAGRGIIEC